MTLTQWLAYARKAAIAITAALAAVAAALTPDSPGGSSITSYEWVTIALAGASAAGVYGFKNATKADLGLEPKPPAA